MYNSGLHNPSEEHFLLCEDWVSWAAVLTWVRIKLSSFSCLRNFKRFAHFCINKMYKYFSETISITTVFLPPHIMCFFSNYLYRTKLIKWFIYVTLLFFFLRFSPNLYAANFLTSVSSDSDMEYKFIQLKIGTVSKDSSDQPRYSKI